MQDLLNLRTLAATSLNPDIEEHILHHIIKSDQGHEYTLTITVNITKSKEATDGK